MRKILLSFILISLWATVSFAAYQISCPSEGITALNQTNQYTTQTTVNGVVVNKTITYDVPYFNSLFNATDCTITQVSDSSVYLSLSPAQMAAKLAKDQQVAQIAAQIQANRNAYIDALIAGDTASQKSIATAQATLTAQQAAAAN